MAEGSFSRLSLRSNSYGPTDTNLSAANSQALMTTSSESDDDIRSQTTPITYHRGHRRPQTYPNTYSEASDDEPAPRRYPAIDPDDSEEESLAGNVAPPEKLRFVIGIDFGTTYTGVAYATPKGAEYKLDHIDVVQKWGRQGTNLPKVPSVISCSSTAQGKLQWGKGINEDAVTMVHMKLELDVQSASDELRFIQQTLDGMNNLHFRNIENPANQLQYTHKKPEVIITDYLGLIFDHIREEISQFGEAIRQQTPVDIVATIPTGWSDRAINSTYRALTQAGFNSRFFPKMADLDQIIFVREPEAAAIYTARHLKNEMRVEIFENGGCFILCDAGGGTVDVVSYRVKHANPLDLVQVGGATADRCGSIFINMEFKKWLRELIGSENYSLIDRNTVMGKITSHIVEGKAMRRLMERFDAFKERFTGDEDEDFRWRLPHPLSKLSAGERPDGGKVVQGVLTLPAAVMAAFFDHCISKIAVLIKDHVRKIEESGYMAKHLFLVGGFGQSPYLKRQLKETFEEWGMELRKPDTPITAVAKGAVICGIEKNNTTNLIRATCCKHSYGIRVGEEFSDLRNDQRDAKEDEITGRILADQQMRWLINKGDAVLSTKPLEVEQEVVVRFDKEDDRSPRKGKLRIWRWSEDKDRPTRYHIRRNVLGSGVCILEYDLSDQPWKEFDPVKRALVGKSVYSALLTLKLSLEWNKLSAQLIWKDKVIARDGNIAY